jgi:hypothetical protein
MPEKICIELPERLHQKFMNKIKNITILDMPGLDETFWSDTAAQKLHSLCNTAANFILPFLIVDLTSGTINLKYSEILKGLFQKKSSI